MTGFEETQRPRQVWIWVIIVGWAFAGLLLPGLLLLTRLRTRVDRHGVHVRFEPFHLRWRSWTFDEIREVTRRTFSPLGEFGGWGIRRGRNGSAYTMAGDSGVELLLADDTRVLIGTREAATFVRAIDDIRLGATG